MSSHPAWICVGTESGMYDRDRRYIILVLQIHKEGTKLAYQKHSFINDSTAGAGHYISILTALLFKDTTCHIELPVKIKPFLHIIRSFHKTLYNIRHTFQCLVTQNIRLDRYFSPSKEFHTFLLNNDLKHTLCLIALQLILRQEEHSHTIITFPANLNSKGFCLFLKKPVRNLKHDTYSITGLTFCILTGTMFQFFHNLQCSGYCVMGFVPLDVDDGTNTTVVVLKMWVI